MASSTGPEKRLGDFIRLRRKSAEIGLTQREVAKRAGITREAYGRIEKGEVGRPHPPHLRAIACVLQVEYAYLEQLRVGDPSVDWPDLAAEFHHIASLPDRQEQLAVLHQLPPSLVADVYKIAETIGITALQDAVQKHR